MVMQDVLLDRRKVYAKLQVTASLWPSPCLPYCSETHSCIGTCLWLWERMALLHENLDAKLQALLQGNETLCASHSLLNLIHGMAGIIGL